MLLLLLMLCLVRGRVTVSSEEYSVTSIWCSYSTSNSSYSLSAVLTKPRGYTAQPVLADSAQAEESDGCSITHLAGLDYKLQISDLASCGVLVRNGFLSVRVWFPQIPGVFTSEDQEVIILCKPPESSSQPVVEPVESVALGEITTEEAETETETEKIQYAVSLYRETSDSQLGLSGGDSTVPIGTLLQLRVSVKPSSPDWRFLSLQELVLSPSASDPRAPGHVTLIRGGCRTQEFAGVVPAPPSVSPNNTREVRLDFEAVMLDINRSQESKVWLHVTTRACTSQARCSVLCHHQEGQEGQEEGGARRVRSIKTETSLGLGLGSLLTVRRLNDREANFTDNIGLSITRPGEGYYSPSPTSLPASQPATNCTTFLIFGILMGCLLIVASVMMCLLAYRLNSLAAVYKVINSSALLISMMVQCPPPPCNLPRSSYIRTNNTDILPLLSTEASKNMFSQIKIV